jgi:type III pantothenate kinase
MAWYTWGPIGGEGRGTEIEVMSSAFMPLLVVDVGNTRIKWGQCDATAVVDSASLPPDDPEAWQRQLLAWHLTGPLRWVVSGVHPARRDRLVEWLRQREVSQEVRVVDAPTLLPLKVALDHPEWAGIDRLLNAVAANTRRQPNHGAAIIDAGSAVTVDYVDERGVFRGGAILPGFRLMAKALHDYTALLPVVDICGEVPMPATATVPAVQGGIFLAIVGGVREVIERYQRQLTAGSGLEVFVTGGDGELITSMRPTTRWPAMTLEGLRVTAMRREGP